MTERTVDDLLREFAMFREAAGRLESAYHELKQHASRVDIELARANEALERALAERERILGALPIGVFQGGADAVRPLNPAASDLLDLLPQLPPPVATSPQATEIEVRDDAGRLRSLRCRRVGLEDGWLDLVEDQTQLHELRREVARLDRLSSLAELSLGVAHEIRNPLNGLAGFAAMLRRHPQSPKGAEWAGKIEEGARRVERIVRDLLAFARPEGRGEAVSRPLAEWLREARTEVPSLAFEVSDPTLPLRGSPRALGKVFCNLARNAAEAGATRVRAGLAAHASGRVRIYFEDDGPGIDEALHDRLFDPFFGTKESGSGLGLAFCARAMEAMDGHIRVVPSRSGARFELELSE